MSETRKLAAILVADVVGYSRLAGPRSDNPVFLKQRERVIDALRAAGRHASCRHVPNGNAHGDGRRCRRRRYFNVFR
jgi:hypothetical protein